MKTEDLPVLLDALATMSAAATDVNLPTLITTLFVALVGGGAIKAATFFYNRKGELRKINVSADSVSVENAAKVLDMVQKQLKATQDDYSQLRDEARQESLQLKAEIKQLNIKIGRLERRVDELQTQLEIAKGKGKTTNGV